MRCRLESAAIWHLEPQALLASEARAPQWTKQTNGTQWLAELNKKNK